MVRKTGIPQLSYTGVEAASPPNFRVFNRAPVSGVQNKDIKGWNLGDEWLDISPLPSDTPVVYKLVSKGSSVAGSNTPTWTALGGSGGGASNFITDSGTATEVGGNLNVLGGDLINTVGSGSTLTVNLDRGTDGQIIIASTAGASMYGSLTSTGGTITVTEGANTLNIDTAGTVTLEIDDDHGGQATPTAGVITFPNGNNTTVTASGSNVTIDVDGNVADSFPTDSGTATPSSGVLTIAGGNNIATSGSGATVTVDLNGTTNHAVQVGNATNSLTSLSVGGDGEVLLGAAGADPAFAALTSTGGTILFTPGANSLNLESTASSSAFNSVVVQTFTSNGTYTPTSGMVYCIVECVGGGGGGGGAGATSSTQVSAGAGGGGGGYARKVLDAATVGASQAVTIGAGGSGGSTAGTDGTTGGITSLGVLVVATGGNGASGDSAFWSITRQGGAGGSGTTGDILINGAYGGSTAGFYVGGVTTPSGTVVSFSFGGFGGHSMYGAGGKQTSTNATPTSTSPATNGTGYGGGGSGPALASNATGLAGGDGSDGIVIVTEFVN